MWLVLPTYNEASNLEAIVAAVREHLEPSTAHPRRRRLLARRHRRDRRSARRRAPGRLGAPPAAQGGPRPGLRRRLSRGAGGRCGARRPDGRRLLPRSRRPCRACSPAQRDADLVLGSRYVHGGGVEDWGPLRRVISRGGCAYARAVLGIGVHDLTGGFKVLSPRGARGDRPGLDLRLRLRLPGRDHLPGDPRRVSGGRAPDRLPRPAGRRVQDDQGASCSRRRGACRRCGLAAHRAAAPSPPEARSRRTSRACCRRS